MQLQLDTIGEKLNAIDRGLFADFGPVLGRMVEQDLVELGPRHLIGRFNLRAIPVLEIKFHSLLAAGAGHFATELSQEPGALELLLHAEASEGFHAHREKRFADVEAGKFLPLADDDAPAGPCEQGGRGAACGAAADNGHVVECLRHAAIKLANSRRKQTA